MMKQCFSVLNLFKLRQSSISFIKRCESSLTNEQCYVNEIDPDLYKLLQKGNVPKVHGKKRSIHHVNFWNYIQGYKNSYGEKSILIDPKVAESISDIVIEKSEKGPDTTLVDGDGVKCMITENLLRKKAFKNATIYLKDKNLRILQEHYICERLSEFQETIKIKDVNLVSETSQFLVKSGNYLSLMNEEQPLVNDWANDPPQYTMIATVTPFVLSYYNFTMIQREHFYSEFHNGRPEFFFLISERSKNRIWNDKLTPFSIFFHTIFDCELLENYPRKSFIPWKIHKSSNWQESLPKFYLIRFRPKKDIGIESLVDFYYLVNIAANKSSYRIIPFIENYIENSGFDLANQGYSTHKKFSDCNIEEFKKIFLTVNQHDNYKNSNFSIQAKNYFKKLIEYNRKENKFANDNSLQITLTKMRYKYGIESN